MRTARCATSSSRRSSATEAPRRGEGKVRGPREKGLTAAVVAGSGSRSAKKTTAAASSTNPTPSTPSIGLRLRAAGWSTGCSTGRVGGGGGIDETCFFARGDRGMGGGSDEKWSSVIR